ncbi:hypothetical protein ACFQ05_38365 [Amycolatopsis umgeniensis]|uniref:Uncharacterized protein n=1 Tax=Amycolatopsis umgeniensis TaxID=336628 RepID=A0A841AZ35_9PSEU|nr:hypothetical protein [Amycolatopsis umgeniensis]MBB5851544.1 hypothetical protein [Amycolatopsis umgeniensis]
MMRQIMKEFQGIEILGMARQVCRDLGDACFSFCGWQNKAANQE